MKSIKVYNYNEFNKIVDTMIMNTKYSKTTDPHRLILTPRGKIKFKQK